MQLFDKQSRGMTPSERKESMVMIEIIANRLKMLITGKHPAVQGAVLADAVATFLAAHYVEDDLVGTRVVRGEIFADFMMTVERLMPICAEEIGTPHDPIIVPGDDKTAYRRQ